VAGTDDEIKRAYRKLAQAPPDLNPGDKAAEARFKDIRSQRSMGRWDKAQVQTSSAQTGVSTSRRPREADGLRDRRSGGDFERQSE
jgi:hypothetical protein